MFAFTMNDCTLLTFGAVVRSDDGLTCSFLELALGFYRTESGPSYKSLFRALCSAWSSCVGGRLEDLIATRLSSDCWQRHS